MKKLTTLALAAAMVMGAATCASAIDFKAKGQWQFGFNVGDSTMTNKVDGHHTDTKDIFGARQRVRLQLDAVASEALSGTVFFEIGHQNWGKGGDGAAMGADGTVVKVRQAYLDWVVPQTDLKIRMGIQNLSLPSAAGDGNVLDNTDTAAIVASYQFNENVGATLMWARPYNDNFTGRATGRTAGALDNVDLFMLSVPLTFDGVEVTPWVMYGMIGKNAFSAGEPGKTGVNTGEALGNYPFGYTYDANRHYGNGYGHAFWAGLPIKVTAFDPFNIELDINYGYVSKMGRYDAYRYAYTSGGYNYFYAQKANTKREGWLVKALVEYKMDWGTPGIFGWYASGDDSNMKNGSERMPYLYAEQKFTSMLGEDVAYTGGHTDMKLSLDGSWGIGLQVKDLSFVEDLKHTLRVAYYGGTNDRKMARYAHYQTGADIQNPWGMNKKDLYLTEKDGILEFNVNSYYQLYENLKMGLELAYAVNMMDNNTWDHVASYSKQDMWSADLTFTYSF
ncbi:outer membrane homotrimeric porin [uncultured Desulfovibrio sp.]|uniref:outer membrane homotrimeric porin n=1 Tax=uncultured Desulfovibrio sp. TaxID=167968 RepID=UPI00261AED66|nr:outer membrane homotrimeric porin [uncultured Desulfovibrio sp.]